MSKCTKQLTNAVAVSRPVGVAGGAIGGGDTQRHSTIGKVREFGVFAEAREHAASSVGNDEFECAGASAVRDQPAVGPAAMFEDVVLQLAERAHQACCQALGQARSNCGVLRVLGPLIPEQVFGVAAGWIEPTQREDARPIASAGAADRTVCQCAFDLMEDRRLDRYAAIGLGRGHASNGEFNQGAYKTGPDEGQRRQQRQPSGNGLPKQVVCCLEGRADAAVLTLVQRCSSLSRSGRLMTRLSYQQSDHSNESLNRRRAFRAPGPAARNITTRSSTLEGYSIAS